MQQKVISVFIVLLSTLAGLALSEAAYRAVVYYSNPRVFHPMVSLPNKIIVQNGTLWKYNDKYGYDYVSEKDLARTTISDGRVFYCRSLDYIISSAIRGRQ